MARRLIAGAALLLAAISSNPVQAKTYHECMGEVRVISFAMHAWYRQLPITFVLDEIGDDPHLRELAEKSYAEISVDFLQRTYDGNVIDEYVALHLLKYRQECLK